VSPKTGPGKPGLLVEAFLLSKRVAGCTQETLNTYRFLVRWTIIDCAVAGEQRHKILAPSLVDRLD
jgi:hypothetical protein